MYWPGAERCNEILKTTRRLGRTIWESGTAPRPVQPGEDREPLHQTAWRTHHDMWLDRQVTGLQAHADVLNRFTRLALSILIARPKFYSSESKFCLSLILSKKPGGKHKSVKRKIDHRQRGDLGANKLVRGAVPAKTPAS